MGSHWRAFRQVVKKFNFYFGKANPGIVKNRSVDRSNSAGQETNQTVFLKAPDLVQGRYDSAVEVPLVEINGFET